VLDDLLGRQTGRPPLGHRFEDQRQVADRDPLLEHQPQHGLQQVFLLSELARGFEVGFVIFLPFLIIDLVVASILMSMGMMMVPPVVVSLPLKLVFFVIADGWTLLAGALVRSYG